MNPKGRNMTDDHTDRKRRCIVIPKEKAVFRMDANGNWHNEHGKFEHPGIIRYFNASIKKDADGYYVYQATDECEEKVYFPYEDTALFAVNITTGPDFDLILNTGERIRPDGGEFFIRNDQLYFQNADHLIKLTVQAMVRISRFIDEKDGDWSIRLNGITRPVESRK